MTLASTERNRSWTAPVYYVYKSEHFYFFSKQTSKHIANSQKTGHASASIHHNPVDWTDIRGLQMEGNITEATKSTHSLQAFKEYFNRFSFPDSNMPAALTDRLQWLKEQFQVRWYTFQPKTVVYLDNSVHFGFKLRLQPNLEPFE